MKNRLSRRTFIQSSSLGFAALVIGCKSDGAPVVMTDAFTDVGTDASAPLPAPTKGEGTWAWVRIAEDNSIYLAMNKAEMGQGIATGITMVLAEELGAAWDQVHVIMEPEIGEFFLPTGGRAGTASGGRGAARGKRTKRGVENDDGGHGARVGEVARGQSG